MTSEVQLRISILAGFTCHGSYPSYDFNSTLDPTQTTHRACRSLFEECIASYLLLRSLVLCAGRRYVLLLGVPRLIRSPLREIIQLLQVSLKRHIRMLTTQEARHMAVYSYSLVNLMKTCSLTLFTKHVDL